MEAAPAFVPVRLASRAIDLHCGHLFLLFNRRHHCVKVLAWDRDVLAIRHQRLESGTLDISPMQREATSLEIDHVKLLMLLSGVGQETEVFHGGLSGVTAKAFENENAIRFDGLRFLFLCENGKDVNPSRNAGKH